MKRDIYASIIISLLTLFFFAFGLYGTLVANEGFFFILGQAFSMYLLIFHPLIFYILGRRLLKIADIRNVPESLIFNMLVLPFFPIAYVLIPVGFSFIDSYGDLSALEFVFIIFEASTLLMGVGLFIRYANRMVSDSIVPRDLYAIHHYYIFMIVYFYFVRLTIISSLLVSGASGI